jgi:alkanesulfonate monooxygenase SsuD/methylene tetrahydromethanopterin reductase-like flavin-dependent oxidoreductase (luciferase family)
VSVPEPVCYPRPLQSHVPIVVGGGAERRTLRLAAKYADASNVLGDADVVRRKSEREFSFVDKEFRAPWRLVLG